MATIKFLDPRAAVNPKERPLVPGLDSLEGKVIGIIDNGKIVALGTSRELKTSSFEKQTMIIYAWNLTHKVVAEVKDKYAEVEVADGTMQITDKQLDFKEVVDRLQSAGAFIRSAFIKEPTLEDVFLRITGKELRE